MASPAADIGTGCSITFSGFTMQATEVSLSGMERASIETTHLKTTQGSSDACSRTFIPGKYADPGILNANVQFNPDALPPIEGTAAAITVTFGSGATWTCSSAFMTSFQFTAPLEELMTATAAWKLSGALNATAAT